MPKTSKNNSLEGTQKINKLYTSVLTCRSGDFYKLLLNFAKAVDEYPEQMAMTLLFDVIYNYKGRLKSNELIKIAEIIVGSPSVYGSGIVFKAISASKVKIAKKYLALANELAGGAFLRDSQTADESVKIKERCILLNKNMYKVMIFAKAGRYLSKMQENKASLDKLHKNGGKKH